MNIKISYAIPVWNEHEELERLLNKLIGHLGDGDEIIIQGDQGKVTDEVHTVIKAHEHISKIMYIEYPLNSNFANFKNNLISECNGDYIFLIDADEFPHEYLLEALKEILSLNPNVNAYAVPRLNVVNGITPEYITQCGWVNRTLPILDSYSLKCLTELNVEIYDDGVGKYVQLINPFDYQVRIIRNYENIRYSGTVHERINVDGLGMFPTTTEHSTNRYYNDFSYCLFHIKDFERQKRQNNFYSTISK